MSTVPVTVVWKRLSEAVLGPALLRRPSDRVVRTIRRQEENSEILVGWMQIAAIIFFAIFYSLAPKAFAPNIQVAPVPVALGVYTLFTALRLVLAYRGVLRTWFLAISVVIDIAVLMITIWSFHLQYDQPPTLYLKAPTLLYVFIIIALRALRFDPRWVILAGSSAAVGWLALLLYAFHGESMSAVLTHSYVEYATSLKLLVGAEVDKIVSIVVVTVVLALVVVRARRLLARSAADEAATMELSRFFAPDVAETPRRRSGRASACHAKRPSCSSICAASRRYRALWNQRASSPCSASIRLWSCRSSKATAAASLLILATVSWRLLAPLEPAIPAPLMRSARPRNLLKLWSCGQREDESKIWKAQKRASAWAGVR
jgi:hypothetical protein